MSVNAHLCRFQQAGEDLYFLDIENTMVKTRMTREEAKAYLDTLWVKLINIRYDMEDEGE